LAIEALVVVIVFAMVVRVSTLVKLVVLVMVIVVIMLAELAILVVSTVPAVFPTLVVVTMSVERRRRASGIWGKRKPVVRREGWARFKRC
jgi:hypothetical protein